MAPVSPVLSRYHGLVGPDAMRKGGDASRIAEVSVQHLTALPGAQIEVLLEVFAKTSDGTTDGIQRTIADNGRTLRSLPKALNKNSALSRVTIQHAQEPMYAT